jgi:hypothetical protein
MRPIRALAIYFAAIFVGGALIAPWLYWTAHGLAPYGGIFAKLAANPFHRFVNRSYLAVALFGIWPLSRICGLRHWRDLGLTLKSRWLGNIAMGFLIGFGSLACVALLGFLCGGRDFNSHHTGADIFRHAVSATISAVIVAMLEEILFRGALFGILRKTQPWPAALCVSSAVYALVHFIQRQEFNGAVTWSTGLQLLPKMFNGAPPFVPALLTLFLAGAILALAYQRTGTLFLSMGLHAGWIFWLKSYGFFTNGVPGANALIWGTDRLIDGWLATPILAGVFIMVWKMKWLDQKAVCH